MYEEGIFPSGAGLFSCSARCLLYSSKAVKSLSSSDSLSLKNSGPLLVNLPIAEKKMRCLPYSLMKKNVTDFIFECGYGPAQQLPDGPDHHVLSFLEE